MSKAQHTPGPWHFSRNSGADGIAPVDILPFRVESEDWVLAELYGDCFVLKASAEANARLIAAAPELLAPAPEAAHILEQYAEYIRSVKADELERHPYLPEIERVAAELRAAISKALGAQS